MSTSATGRPVDDAPPPRDAAYWAAPVTRLVAASEAIRAYGVEGRRLMGPHQGFGQLWQRTHRMALPGIDRTPEEVVAEWKSRFGDYWPTAARFHAPDDGIAPGGLAGLDAGLGPMSVVSTGVFVIYADETSFAYMTPQGHFFAGWITFSAEDVQGVVVAQISLMIRTADPFIEVAWRLGMARTDDWMWRRTLRNVGAGMGAQRSPVETRVVRLDDRCQWHNWRNVRHFAGFRTITHGFRAPRTR